MPAKKKPVRKSRASRLSGIMGQIREGRGQGTKKKKATRKKR